MIDFINIYMRGLRPLPPEKYVKSIPEMGKAMKCAQLSSSPLILLITYLDLTVGSQLAECKLAACKLAECKLAEVQTRRVQTRRSMLTF